MELLDVLANGATVVAFTLTRPEATRGVLKGGVLLAMRRDSRDPYVTWEYSFEEDGRVTTFQGHYWSTFRSATRDYEDRVSDS